MVSPHSARAARECPAGRYLALRAAFDGDRGRVALAGDRLDHLDADPGEAVVGEQALRDAFRGRLDELELALDDDGLDGLRDRGVVERVRQVVTAAALATSAAMSTANTSACSVSRSQSYTPMTVETRRSLIDTVSAMP